MPVIPHIAVIGSLNVDIVTFAARCPGPGETLMAKSRAISAGGKGANQAVACGRASFASHGQQDVKVTMIGAVGNGDQWYMDLLKPALESSRVSTTYIKQLENSQTGSATIIVEEGTKAENRILVVPGANHSGMEDVNEIIATIHGQQLDGGVVILQGEIPKPTVLGLLKYFNKFAVAESVSNRKTSVIFNPAPMFEDGMSMSDLSGTAVLIMNETETAQLLRLMPGLETASIKPSDLIGDHLNHIARQLHDLADVKILLITLGSKGVFFSTATGIKGQVEATKVENVLDTTAAGDTFVGYFATQFAQFLATGASIQDLDSSLRNIIKQASLAASVCVQRRGALETIPFAYELCH
ncbi:ribokinase [Trichoderma velutinum]